MSYQYSLDQNDYMTFLYYSTSKSKRVQRRRALNKLVLMIIYVLTGMMLFNRNGPIASAAFFLLCLPLYFMYNWFEKKQYVKHFTRFINTHFQDRIGKPASIELEDDKFHVIDEEDNWHAYEDIEEISEINEMVIVQLKNGVAILLPKNKIRDVDKLVAQLTQQTSQKKIPYNSDLGWKWK